MQYHQCPILFASLRPSRSRGAKAGCQLPIAGRYPDMPRCYDAIVIGAGPAGTTTALRLAEAGLSVLLMERERLPRDKPCGGGLTPKARGLLPVPVEDLVLNRANSVLVKVGSRLSTRFHSREAAIWMVRRRELDFRLAESAARRGAEIHDGEAFRSLELGAEVRVASEMDGYRCRVVVGADGAESRVAALLRVPRSRRMMVALEAEGEVEGDPLAGEAIVDLAVPGGYAWVFPKGDVYNVGLGSFDPRVAGELRPRFRRFLEETGLASARLPAPIGHRIPTGPPPRRLHGENALVVGDAAGVADPFFGEGISHSLFTGELAAKAVVDYLEGRSRDLSPYTRRVGDALTREARLWRATAALVYRAPYLSLKVLAGSRRLRAEVERAIAGEVGLCQQWCRADCGWEKPSAAGGRRGG